MSRPGVNSAVMSFLEEVLGKDWENQLKEEATMSPTSLKRTVLCSIALQGLDYSRLPKSLASEVVEVEGTTPEAFASMINYIYRLPQEGTFNLATCPQMLFDLLNLAEKYEILPLKIITSQALEALDISRQNLIFSATVATKYKNTGFGDLSQKLLLKCLEFLFRMTKGAGDILALINETKKTFPDASLEIFHDLISVGKDVLQVPGIYSNFGNSI